MYRGIERRTRRARKPATDVRVDASLRRSVESPQSSMLRQKNRALFASNGQTPSWQASEVRAELGLSPFDGYLDVSFRQSCMKSPGHSW
jgi:hypothetical protein